jgi:hypothetical protein
MLPEAGPTSTPRAGTYVLKPLKLEIVVLRHELSILRRQTEAARASGGLIGCCWRR